MALEQTYNCEGKTALFKGLTQNSDAIDKYIRIFPIMTAVSQKVNEMAHFNKSQNSHHRDSRNEAILQKEYLNRLLNSTSLINPWDTGETDL